MKKYRIEFEFMYKGLEVSDGKNHKDIIDNNGEGFTLEEANALAARLYESEIQYTRWVKVVEMEG